MGGASIEATLELWAWCAAGCEGADAAAVYAGAGCGFGRAQACLAMSSARRAGCGRRRRAILARGDSRPFWAAAGGKLTTCARGLLIRRTIADQDLAFFSTWAPAGTLIDKLVRVEGCRWAIEDSFETAKNELGLDHNETRSWHGWNRHVSLVMLAFAMMATIQHRANAVPNTANDTLRSLWTRRLSAGQFRKFAA